MTILIIIVLLAFGTVFYYSSKKKYANEQDPILKKKMIRKSFWIGFSPLILAVLVSFGLLVYLWMSTPMGV